MIDNKKRKEKSTLSVLLNDDLINKGSAADTFSFVINKISNLVGKENLYKDFPNLFNTENFVSNKSSRIYNTLMDDSNKYFIKTHNSTEYKKTLIEAICSKYNINVEVSILGAEKVTDRKVWLYSPGENARLFEEFYSDGIIALGWDSLGDLTQYSSMEEILKNLKTEDSNPTNTANINYSFLDKMNIGDLVIAKRGRSEIVGYGEVISDYYFNNEKENYKSCRDVNWIKRGSWNTDYMMSIKTLTDVTSQADRFLEIIEEKNASIVFFYKNQLIKIEESNSRKLHDKIINWLFINGYTFDSEYHNTQWRKTYSEIEKEDLIKRVNSYNDSSFYKITNDKFILKNSNLDFVKRMLELHGCKFSKSKYEDEINVSEIEDVCKATLDIKRCLTDYDFLCDKLNNTDKNYISSYYRRDSGVVIDIRKDVAKEILLGGINKDRLLDIIKEHKDKNPQKLKTWSNPYKILHPLVNHTYIHI